MLYNTVISRNEGKKIFYEPIFANEFKLKYKIINFMKRSSLHVSGCYETEYFLSNLIILTAINIKCLSLACQPV